MKTKSKALFLAVSVALIVIASMFGTLAYLSDTKTVANTFTVGQVHIKLDEAPVNDDGKATSGDRVTSNIYHLLPGQEYDKDPTVTVLKGSDKSYIRMIVTIQNISGVKKALGEDFLPQYYVTGWDETVWISTKSVKIDENANTATYEFRYKDTVEALNGDVVLEALFKTIKVPDSFTNKELAYLYYEVDDTGEFVKNDDGSLKALDKDHQFKIEVVAHAIQVAGFENNVDGAWAAFDAQYAAN